MYNVNEELWPQVIYLINNFFIPVAYTKGRDIYPDRVTFARSRVPECIFEIEKTKNIEYFTLNARSVERSSKAILKTREIVEKVLTDSLFSNEMLNFEKNDDIKKDYTKLFDYVQKKLMTSQVKDYEKLNDFILQVYKKLDINDAIKVASLRESSILRCITNNLISEEYGKEQIELFPNSTLKLQSLYNIK